MWIQSYSGKAIHLDGSFSVDDVVVEDLSRGLSNTCRYGGQSKLFYSVAEHSINVMYRVRELVKPGPRARRFGATRRQALIRKALLHDAAEAYLGDIPTPLKRMLPQYKRIEAQFEAVLAERFDLPMDDEAHRIIKQADYECLAAERDEVFPTPPPADWSGDLDVPDPWLGCEVVGWSPPLARMRFRSALRAVGIDAQG